MVQVAIYCRVSADDQSCDRQERNLRAFAERVTCVADYRALGRQERSSVNT
jgi:DNA invertase Pin-like site-specific DNA recombinase